MSPLKLWCLLQRHTKTISITFIIINVVITVTTKSFYQTATTSINHQVITTALCRHVRVLLSITAGHRYLCMVLLCELEPACRRCLAASNCLLSYSMYSLQQWFSELSQKLSVCSGVSSLLKWPGPFCVFFFILQKKNYLPVTFIPCLLFSTVRPIWTKLNQR